MARDDSETAVRPIDGRTCIGHVHLKVADLDRALAFYSGILGFDVRQRMGTSAAFLSAGASSLIGREIAAPDLSARALASN